MGGQTDRALDRARERFAVQDYYGTVHLLEEIVATGRAFADVHHLLGVSLVLVKSWERGAREPSLMARRLLDTIKAEPSRWLAAVREMAPA